MKIKVRTPFGSVEDVCLEDCIRVYRKQYDSEYYLERADGVDGIISEETVDFLFKEYPDLVHWKLYQEIDWRVNYEARVAAMLERLTNT